MSLFEGAIAGSQRGDDHVSAEGASGDRNATDGRQSRRQADMHSDGEDGRSDHVRAEVAHPKGEGSRQEQPKRVSADRAEHATDADQLRLRHASPRLVAARRGGRLLRRNPQESLAVARDGGSGRTPPPLLSRKKKVGTASKAGKWLQGESVERRRDLEARANTNLSGYASNYVMKNPHAVALGRLGGAVGGRARAQALTAEQRQAIAQRAGIARSQGLSPEARRDLARRAALARWRRRDRQLTAADAPLAVRRLLKSYDPAALRWENRNDRHAIVREIVLRGDPVARRWLGRRLSRDEVRKLVRAYRGAGCAEPDRQLLRRKLALTTADIPIRPYIGFRRREDNAVGSRTRAALKFYGAHLLQSEQPLRKPPPLEEVLAAGLSCAHSDASLAGHLPIVLHKNSKVDLDELCRLARLGGESQTLGFFLDLTDELTGQQRLSAKAETLRDGRVRRMRNFFSPDGRFRPFEQELAEINSPEVARRWHFLMNMSLESFRSYFRKGTERLVSLSSSPGR